jgi:hypothetical protein
MEAALQTVNIHAERVVLLEPVRQAKLPPQVQGIGPPIEAVNSQSKKLGINPLDLSSHRHAAMRKSDSQCQRRSDDRIGGS